MGAMHDSCIRQTSSTESAIRSLTLRSIHHTALQSLAAATVRDPPIWAAAAAAPAAADDMPSRMFCLPPVVWRDAASCGLDHASPVSRSADSACVRHLLLFSAAGTVIGRGCELGGLSLRAAARLRPPAPAPGVFGHCASGPWQVLAGLGRITMFTAAAVRCG